MHKTLWQIPGLGVPVSSFGVCLLVACFSALGLTVWRARRERIDPESVVGLAVWLMGGGFVGARLLYLVSHPDSVRSLADVLRLWQGGIVYYGCLIGGLIGSLIYWSRNPFPFRAMADAVAPSLCLGLAVGRLGCFLNGCCFGAPSELPWALRFPAGTSPWAKHVHLGLIEASSPLSLPVHPTQLYSVLDGLVLLGLLSLYYPRRTRDGQVMALLMVTYPFTRFVIEAFRDDEPALLVGMTLSQAISVLIFLGGLVAWGLLWNSRPSRYADSAADDTGALDEPFTQQAA